MSKLLTGDHVALAFGTPVSTYLWPASEGLNAALCELILGRGPSDTSGLHSSNVGGWHSSRNILEWDADAVRTLRDQIIRMATDLVEMTAPHRPKGRLSLGIDSWANVSRRGNYTQMHNHPGAVWSGVYYVSSGEPEGDAPFNGKLELFDPRQAISMLAGEFGPRSGKFLVDPLPGLMIFFPGWLNHMVHPFEGRGERISIAFNIVVSTSGGTDAHGRAG